MDRRGRGHPIGHRLGEGDREAAAHAEPDGPDRPVAGGGIGGGARRAGRRRRRGCPVGETVAISSRRACMSSSDGRTAVRPAPVVQVRQHHVVPGGRQTGGHLLQGRADAGASIRYSTTGCGPSWVGWWTNVFITPSAVVMSSSRSIMRHGTQSDRSPALVAPVPVRPHAVATSILCAHRLGLLGPVHDLVVRRVVWSWIVAVPDPDARHPVIKAVETSGRPDRQRSMVDRRHASSSVCWRGAARTRGRRTRYT